MSVTPAPQQMSARSSVRTRTLRLIALVVMMAFTIFGAVGLVGVQASARQLVRAAHVEDVARVRAEIIEQSRHAREDIRRIAGSQAARQFASTTLNPVANTGSALEDAQLALLQEFDSLLSVHPDEFLAIRYVTFSGAVWTEITNTGGIRRPITRVRPNEFNDDATLVAALGSANGDVLTNELDFRTNPDAPVSERLTPFLRFASPVLTESSATDIAGVIQIDLAIAPTFEVVNAAGAATAAAQPGRRLIVTDDLGRVLSDSSSPDTNFIRNLANRVPQLFSQVVPELAAAVEQSGVTELSEADDLIFTVERVLLAENSDRYWQIVLVDERGISTVYQTPLALSILLGSLALGLVIVVLVDQVLRRTLSPIQQLKALSSGARPVSSGADSELDGIIAAFSTMSETQQKLRDEIDAQKGRFNRNLDIAARIGRETATLYDTDILLNRAINLICDEFGYYHAQVFRIDDAGINAVLVVARGEVGAEMLRRGYRIPVGSESVIGSVIRTGKAMIVADAQRTDAEQPFMYEPLLPETRSEMALPLVVGQRVIGGLDIQSRNANDFRDEDVRMLQILADQIAIALENARLLRESQERFAQIDTLNRQLTNVNWDDPEGRNQIQSVYHYDLLSVRRGGDTGPIGETGDLRIPITIRGKVIGSLEAAAPRGLDFTEGDETIMRAVADRLGIAIENARLFEQQQASLFETSTLYQLVRALNEANSLEEVLESVMMSVIPDAISAQIGVFDKFTGSTPRLLEVLADWTNGSDDQRDVKLSGLQLEFADHPVLYTMQPNQVVIINDTDRDMRLDEVFRAIVSTTNGRAMVVIPVTVRGEWRGIMMIQFGETREFSEREGRLFSSLIDQVGVVIDNRMLLRDYEVQVEQVERLYSASRKINIASNPTDLLTAAMGATQSRDREYELVLFEGDLEGTGWPSQMRLVSYTRGGIAYSSDETYTVHVANDSPLRQRNAQIITIRSDADKDESDSITPHSLTAYVRARGNRFAAVFPLFSANQPIALFFITSEQARDALTAEDYDAYLAMTGQMSTVLQNRRLLEQTTATLDETRRLYAASRAIAGAQDQLSIYEAAARYLTLPTAPITRMSVLLANTPSPAASYVEYRYIHTRDSTQPSPLTVGTQIPASLIPFGELLLDSRSLAFNRAADFDEAAALRPLLAQSGSRSAAVVSLQSRQQWFGALLIESIEADTFSGSYLVFAQAVADQIAIALDSLRLFQEAQAQAQRALALAQAGQLANQIGAAFEQSIAEVFQRVSEAADYDRWLLTLFDDAQGGLQRVVEYSAARGVADSSTEGGLVPLDAYGIPMVDAYHTGRMLLVNDPSSYPNFPRQYAGLPDFSIYVGKHIAVPIRLGDQIAGAMAIGRGLDQNDLDENDEELVRTLSAQVEIALENRRLFRAAESERQNLRSILETLPAGVLVLDAQHYRPVQFNQQAVALLGREIDPTQPFTIKDYNLYQTSSNAPFVTSEMPIFQASKEQTLASSDDVTVMLPGGARTNLLVNAAPITDANGDVTAIVAAFQDISQLRELEQDLQINLTQTTALYETTRALTEGETVDVLLDQIMLRLESLDPRPIMAYVLLLEDAGLRVARASNVPEMGYQLPDDMLTQNTPLIIAHTASALSFSEQTRLELGILGIQAFFSLPMLARARSETPIGWLVGIYDQPQPALNERADYLSTLTDSAAVAIDNRNLFRNTQSALQEANNLYRATTTISRVRGREQLADALRTTLETLKPDVFAAYLYLDETGEQRLTELFNINLDAAPHDFPSLIERYNIMNYGNLYIDDVRSISKPSGFEQALIDLGTIRALALVRMYSSKENQPSGSVLLGYHRPQRFDDSIARYLGAITDSASVIVDNLLLLDQIQSNLDETSTLYQASRALSDAATPADIVDVAQRYLHNRPLSAVFMASLLSRDWEQPDAIVRVAAYWRDAERLQDLVDLNGITLNREQFPAWRLLAVDDVYTVDDATDAAIVDPMEQAGILSIGMQSAAFLPLRVSGKAIGTLVIGSETPYRHTERDLRVYRAFAEQASLRLDATRLYEQAQRRAAQLALSAEVSSAASSILDLQFLLSRIVDLIKDAFKYDHAQIFLMDNNNEYAVLRASTGDAGRALLSINHRLARGSASVIGQVTETAQPTIAADTADARVVHRPNPYLPGTRSELALPLILKGSVVGALDVQSNQPNAFDDDDITVLKTLAAQISVAIDNAGLYEDAQRRAHETAFLFNVTSQAAAADTLQHALQDVADNLRAELTAQVVAMYLPRFYLEADESIFTQLEPIALAGITMPLSELTPVRLDEPNNLIAEAGANRRPFILTELEHETRYLPIAVSAKSALIVPFIFGTQLVGLVVCESPLVNGYTDATLTLMQTLAGSLASIVQNQQLLEQVQRQNEALRELDKLKSDFLANMSHELRTPLNSIIGFSRVILKGIDGPLTEMQEQDLSTIYNSGLHLLNLINDILDQAKIAAGKMDLQSDFFEMKSVIDGVRSIGIGLVKEKPIDIQVHIAPGLPKAYGDEFRTRQVLINLISNAAKFTKQGTITMDVYTVNHETTGKLMIRVDVIDTGIGIAEKDIPLLFEEFRQVDSSLTRTQGGTGLGLPIAKSLVEMQGGEMVVKSQVNVGSTFTIVIPTEPTLETGDSPTGQLRKVTGRLGQTAPLDPSVVNAVTGMNGADDTQERPYGDETGDGAEAFPPARPPMHIKRQILLIEDNPDMVDQFRRVLQREGFDIFAASIPLEAEAMASGLHPTIIVMDVNFAEGQGWQILERLRGRDDTRDIPVVVVTLDPNESAIRQAGAFAYLGRPFTPEQLSETVLDAEREARVDRILIIDDQQESIKVIEDLLSEQGRYKVFTAGSAMDGISMVARRRPDLVILDLRMPEMDGFQVINELRANPETATIPIIVVTGETLNASERDQLTHLPVMFKADINAGQRRQFIDGVKSNLSRGNGG